MKAALVYTDSRTFGEICHVYVWRRGTFYLQVAGRNMEDALSSTLRAIETERSRFDSITIAAAKQAVLELEDRA